MDEYWNEQLEKTLKKFLKEEDKDPIEKDIESLWVSIFGSLVEEGLQPINKMKSALKEEPGAEVGSSAFADHLYLYYTSLLMHCCKDIDECLKINDKIRTHLLAADKQLNQN